MKPNFIATLTYFTAVMLCCSCNKETQPNTLTLRIDPTLAQSGRASEVLSELEYLPLTAPMIGEIGKIIHHNNRFFIQTKYPDCIYIYSDNGNMISNICAQGEGPNKYKSITDFTIAPDGQSVWLLQRRGLKIFNYDTQGNFIADYKIPVFATKLEVYDQDNIVLYCGNEKTDHNTTKIVFFNHKTGEVREGPFPIDAQESQYLNFVDRNNFLVTPEANLYFFYGFNDTIYRIDQNRAIPERIIDFGKYSIPKEFFTKRFQDVMDFMTQVRQNNYAFRIIGYYETPLFIHFIFEFRERFLLLFYDKQTQNYKLNTQLQDDIILPGLILYDDVDRGAKATTKDNRLIFSMEAPYISQYVDSLKRVDAEGWKRLTTQHPSLSKLDTLNDSSNPVLVLGRLRSF